MTRIFLLGLLLIVSISSCKKDEPASGISACGVNDPVNNLPWLKDKIADEENNPTQLTVRMFEFKGTTYFDFTLPVMSCMTCRVFDCEGKLVSFQELHDDEDYSDFIAASRNESARIVWQGKDAF